MLVPDWLYSRIPHIWLSIGLLFLLIGIAAGPDFRLFYAYLLLGCSGGSTPASWCSSRARLA